MKMKTKQKVTAVVMTTAITFFFIIDLLMVIAVVLGLPVWLSWFSWQYIHATINLMVMSMPGVGIMLAMAAITITWAYYMFSPMYKLTRNVVIPIEQVLVLGPAQRALNLWTWRRPLKGLRRVWQ